MRYIDNGKYQIISAVYHLGSRAKVYDFIAKLDFSDTAKVALVESSRDLQIPLQTVWVVARGLKPRDINYTRMVQSANKKEEAWK